MQYVNRWQRRLDADVKPQVQHPAGVMAWLAFSADGFFKVRFVPPNVKINADYYIKEVLTPFLNKYLEKYPSRNILKLATENSVFAFGGLSPQRPSQRQ